MRTTKWNTEQQDALDKLRADGRIQNERPCGCFDVLIEEYPNEPVYKSLISFVPCDTCRESLAKWRPEVFGKKTA